MRVVTVSLSQLHQLQSVHKSFFALVCGSWQAKNQNELWELLVERIGTRGLHSFVLFRLVVEVNSDAEEYCINILELRSLPSLVLFSRGVIQGTVNLSNGLAFAANLTAFRNPQFAHEELTRYDPNTNHIISLVGSSAASQSIGQLFLSGDRSSVGKSSIVWQFLCPY